MMMVVTLVSLLVETDDMVEIITTEMWRLIK